MFFLIDGIMDVGYNTVIKKIKEIFELGEGYCFICTIYEGCPVSMNKSDGIPFVEEDVIGIKIDLSAGRCFFIHNGKVVEKDRDV